ncbi:RecG protein [Wolbachia endosymbiont of Armadillidium vulgare str. wVulC]|nr:hypothetical protein [Wolbachia endosymbiont of Armadillidium vulgare]KLT22657.1 RecG protein [Wolbachia endosymbiont of Armadillidium vulgare str. wVulC]
MEQPDILIFLSSKLGNIPKFHSAILPKLCGGDRVMDLLFYRPLSYVDRSKSLLDAQIGELQLSWQKFMSINRPLLEGGHIK